MAIVSNQGIDFNNSITIKGGIIKYKCLKCKDFHTNSWPIKSCSVCKVEQKTENFNHAKRYRDGLFPECKSCYLKRSKKYIENLKQNNPEILKKWQENINSKALIKKKCEKIYLEEKFCKDCNVIKKRNSFQKNIMRYDGLSDICKICIKQEFLNHLLTVTIPTDKICIDCNVNKDIIFFGKDYKSPDGYFNNCKLCNNTYAREKDKLRRPQRDLAKQKRIDLKREEIKKYASNDLKTRICRAFCYLVHSKKSRNYSEVNFFQYSSVELRNYIEKLWQPWMSWSNYGRLKSDYNPNDISTWTWQIDHIIPKSKLLYKNIDDPVFLLSWSLKNLQPLGSKENILKARKIKKEDLESFKKEIDLELYEQLHKLTY